MALGLPVPEWYFMVLVVIHIFTVSVFGWVSQKYSNRGEKDLGRGIGIMNWFHELPELIIFSAILWLPAVFPTLGRWFYYYGLAMVGFIGLFLYVYHWANDKWLKVVVVLVVVWHVFMLAQSIEASFLSGMMLYAPVYLSATGATIVLWGRKGSLLVSGMGAVAVTEFVESILCVRLTLSVLFGGTSVMMIMLLIFLALQIIGPSMILLGYLRKEE